MNRPRITADPLRALAIVGALAIVAANFALMSPYAHFAWLAEAFWHGRLDIGAAHAAASGFIDIALFHGRFYWPLAPLPAVLLMPVVPFIGTDVAQAVLQVLAVFALAWAAYRVAGASGLGRRDAAWMALAFMLGSVTVGVAFANTPWQIANVLATLFLMLAVLAHRKGAHPAAVGALAAAAFLTRYTAGVGAIYFGVLELLADRPWRERLRRLCLLALPFMIAFGVFAAYNAARFGNPMETGYAYHHLAAGPAHDRREAYGLFNAAFIGRNVYYYFFRMPELRGGFPVVDPEGVSFFLLSPIFLWLAVARVKRREFIAAAVATVPALAAFMTYFATGMWQFGPRYLLDVLPFWFVVLALTFARRGLGRLPKAVIWASAFANLALYAIFLFYR